MMVNSKQSDSKKGGEERIIREVGGPHKNGSQHVRVYSYLSSVGKGRLVMTSGLRTTRCQ